jgi:DegV family protein with EDD domain
MPKIAIITDSDSSLPPKLAQEYSIFQVPITIHFGEESYTTGLDIDDELLFKLIDQYQKLPTTSAPPPDRFVKAYQVAFDQGADSVICICVSSKISATYSAAVNAREMLPDKDITVIDSLNLCMAQGFMALAAAEAVAKGASKEEIISLVNELGKNLTVYAALPTLKYLAMGGRVGKLAAGLANTLNIKPILTSRDGKLELLEKIRTQKKAEMRLIELFLNAAQGKKIEKLAMVHVNNRAGAEKLFHQIQSQIQLPDDFLYAEFTPGLSVHAGSGVVGYALVTSEI